MNLSHVRIHEYSAADRAKCLSIFDSNVPHSFTEDERPEFERFIDALPGPYFVFELPNGLAVACGGYAAAPGTTCADLCWGMVALPFQGIGLGRLLTEVRLQRIKQDPAFTEVALRTSQHTEPFYERLGFRTERITENGIAPGLHKCEMRLDLVPAE